MGIRRGSGPSNRHESCRRSWGTNCCEFFISHLAIINSFLAALLCVYAKLRTTTRGGNTYNILYLIFIEQTPLKLVEQGFQEYSSTTPEEKEDDGRSGRPRRVTPGWALWICAGRKRKLPPAACFLFIIPFTESPPCILLLRCFYRSANKHHPH